MKTAKTRDFDFDFENVDQLETAEQPKTVTGEAAAADRRAYWKKSDAPVMNARDRRVIVFDFSAMEPEQIDRRDAAKKYINTQMHQPTLSHCIAGDDMHVDVDFT